jgi:hypothetical protein
VFDKAGRLDRRHRVLVLGDSHATIVARAVRRHCLAVWVRQCIVPGATAQGLVNPNSKSDALRIFQRRIDAAPKGVSLVFELGEVDCGFVIWYRAEKYGLSIESQLQYSLNAYSGFLMRQAQAGFGVYVLSAPPPTIQDGQAWGEVANIRRQVTVSLVRRAELTATYNARLAEVCTASGIRFLDVTTETLDVQSGLVRPDMTSGDPLNHHLDPDRWGAIIGCALSAELDSLVRRGATDVRRARARPPDSAPQR